MIQPLLSLERISLDVPTGKVGYRYGKGARSLSAASPHALTHFELNLTTDGAPIYNSPR